MVPMSENEGENIPALISQFGVFSLHGFQNMSDFSHGLGDGSLSIPVMLACHTTFLFGSFEGKGTARFRESLQRDHGLTLGTGCIFFQEYTIHESYAHGCLGFE